jgi:hypothetical protein
VIHKLVNNTLTAEKDSIVAYCVCGWASRPCFSSLMASVEFDNHKEHYHRPIIRAHGPDCPCLICKNILVRDEGGW